MQYIRKLFSVDFNLAIYTSTSFFFYFTAFSNLSFLFILFLFLFSLLITFNRAKSLSSATLTSPTSILCGGLADTATVPPLPPSSPVYTSLCNSTEKDSQQAYRELKDQCEGYIYGRLRKILCPKPKVLGRRCVNIV
jgi:hypothetical protein